MCVSPLPKIPHRPGGITLTGELTSRCHQDVMNDAKKKEKKGKKGKKKRGRSWEHAVRETMRKLVAFATCSREDETATGRHIPSTAGVLVDSR